ncbi:MAG: 2-oxoacid:acceptor oxidoreductase family protein [Candidatus Omnitrophica bacterium]|nr:2-oxoacid:acceptor oxidoreductase family protein [Candidatus Omnitrophota bacterium]
MLEKIIIAGSGGQGIMLLGKVLAEAALLSGKFTTWLPAYGPEVRGGCAHCMVIISDAEIGSPHVDKADTLIIMNQASLVKFKNRLKSGGLMIVNSSLAAVENNPEIRSVSARFTDIAIDLGNIKVANMAALGKYLTNKKIIAPENIVKAMAKIAPKGQPELLRINIEAFNKGMES